MSSTTVGIPREKARAEFCTSQERAGKGARTQDTAGKCGPTSPRCEQHRRSTVLFFSLFKNCFDENLRINPAEIVVIMVKVFRRDSNKTLSCEHMFLYRSYLYRKHPLIIIRKLKQRITVFQNRRKTPTATDTPEPSCADAKRKASPRKQKSPAIMPQNDSKKDVYLL